MKKSLLFITTFCILCSNSMYSQLAGQVPLNPKSILQFVDPLPHFAGNRINPYDLVFPYNGNITIKYEPTQQVAVSTGTVLATGIVGLANPNVGKARYWAYSIWKNGNMLAPPHWPAFTIEAKRGFPLNVVYENKLNGETYASVNLIADQTIHWAAPTGMDMMNMMPYDGPVPVVAHLHGAEVASESDGGPEAWFTPDYGIIGPSWGNGGTDQNYIYPNSQEAATLWWHDHALGATRLNVYAGLAGFYFLRDDAELNANPNTNLKLPGWPGDDLVQQNDRVTGLPVGVPYLPEIEVVFQDRMFDNTGALYYPNLPPNPMDHPFWTPEFIGDVITVNGKTWPYLSVAPRKYRFRLLNGSNARFYEISLNDLFSNKKGPAIIQIGTDGGLLDASVTINGKLLLAPGERADVVIDFSLSSPGQAWTLTNTANAPFPKGGQPNTLTTGRLMQFIVNGQMVPADPLLPPGTLGTDKSLIPTDLRFGVPLVKLTNFAGTTTPGLLISKKRQITLNEVMGMGGPLEVLLNNTKWNAGVTENPTEGTTELWQIINMTADAHPIHLHLVQFQLVGRQKFNTANYNKAYNRSFLGGAYIPASGPPLIYNTPNIDGALGGNPAISPYLQQKLTPANLNERGWKDTYIVYPGEVTTFVIRYAPTDLPTNAPPESLIFGFDPSLGPGYVWHCHIIDHEDNEMMRPYAVVKSPFRPALAMKSTNSNSNGKGTNPVNSILSNISDMKYGFELGQSYPNPGIGETKIEFQIPENMRIRLTLYNQLGQQVKVLIDADAPAGNNTVVINREGLEKGLYYYSLQAGSFKATKKLILE